MLVGRRFRLKPNKEQEKWLRQSAGVSRFIYQAVKDMLSAYSNFFKRGARGSPRFKKKGRCKESLRLSIFTLKNMFGMYVTTRRILSLEKTTE